MLFSWADVILIVGESQLAAKVNNSKTIHINIDCYGHYGHPTLQNKLKELIKPIIK